MNDPGGSSMVAYKQASWGQELPQSLDGRDDAGPTINFANDKGHSEIRGTRTEDLCIV